MDLFPRCVVGGAQQPSERRGSEGLSSHSIHRFSPVPISLTTSSTPVVFDIVCSPPLLKDLAFVSGKSDKDDGHNLLSIPLWREKPHGPVSSVDRQASTRIAVALQTVTPKYWDLRRILICVPYAPILIDWQMRSGICCRRYKESTIYLTEYNIEPQSMW